MIYDLERENASDFPEPEICIVGAGAAGVILACELVRQGRRVLLLEGGGLQLEPGSQELYQSDVVGLPHRGIHTGRFRTYGGTTTQWGGQILELDQIDFSNRPWIDGSGWPISKDTLTSYYERALVSEGLANCIKSDADVWQALSIKPADIGQSLFTYFTRWMPDPLVTRIHAKTLDGPNIGVFLHANVVSVSFAENGDRAQFVRCQTLSGKQAEFKASEFVLCLGSIESVRFLLQPQNAAPWQGNSWLGRHFTDHIDASCALFEDIDPVRFHTYFDNVYLHGFKYQPKIKLSSVLQQKEGLLNVSAMIQFESDADQVTSQIKTTARSLLGGRFGNVSSADVRTLASNAPYLIRQIWRYQRHKRAYVPKDAKIVLRVSCEQHPLSPSEITLSTRRDPLGLFRAKLNWRITPLERQTMWYFVESVQRAFKTARLARLVIDSDFLRNDGSFDLKCDDLNHHMGGTRMGSSAMAGVVDTHLQIHGTQNVYICSAAVFPSGGSSNPTHTVLALALRLADRLAKRSMAIAVQTEASQTS